MKSGLPIRKGCHRGGGEKGVDWGLTILSQKREGIGGGVLAEGWGLPLESPSKTNFEQNQKGRRVKLLEASLEGANKGKGKKKTGGDGKCREKASGKSRAF